jgi:Histidine kinase-, DNA gyrase B-, and HSP90-like ATPase
VGTTPRRYDGGQRLGGDCFGGDFRAPVDGMAAPDGLVRRNSGCSAQNWLFRDIYYRGRKYCPQILAAIEPQRGIQMPNDNLLNELERQEKYLAELPADFTFPLFNTKRALDSQRQNGYRNTAVAAREIVDNAFEAKATKVHVIFDTAVNSTRPVVSSVAFLDDGAGMLKKMARFALSWGGGTHFDDPNFIGKFGFGLPNASINQTRTVEVYTRTKKSEPIIKGWLNLDDYKSFDQQSVPEPVEAELPAFVKKYMKKIGFEFDHGTIVVWKDPDQLTYKSPKLLEGHLLDDFGVTYQYLLEGRELIVNGTPVQAVDPLFLNPKARLFLPEAERGAINVLEKPLTIWARYFRDQTTGAMRLEKVTDASTVDQTDPSFVAVGAINVRVSRLPYGFAMGSKKDASDDAKQRFEIRQTRRGMSFVRAGREIETLDAFPRSARDRASGLGDWPLLQSYAYHWGIEVSFGPEFDDVFGITNDKQRVRPIDDFWRLLSQEGVDALLRRENDWQHKTREEEQRKKKMEKAEATNAPTPAEEAAATVPMIVGRKMTVPDRAKPEARRRAEEEIERQAKETKLPVDEIRKAREEEEERRKIKIDYFDDPHGPFYRPEWVGLQMVVKVNRHHPFFTVCYGEIVNLVGGYKAKQALDVLLIALGKAELELTEDLAIEQYRHLREEVWSRFLAVALQNLNANIQPPDEREEGNAAVA